MDRATEIRLVQRVLAHVANRTTDREDAPSRLPVKAYLDGARNAREQAVLFRELPLPIAHVSMLPNPGDFVAHDASGVPILLVRGDDGAIRAFLNVCRHRGTRLTGAKPCGAAKAFVCPYHAWSYDREGHLLGIPHERGFDGIDRAERGLVPLPVDVAAGLVWVRPSPARAGEAPLDARAWLGDLAADLEHFGLASGHVYSPHTTTRDLSWKVAIDVFLEAYHLRPTHLDTIYGMFFDNLGVVETFGPHLRNLFPKRSIRGLAKEPEETWSLRAHANVLYQLFPSSLVLVQPDHAAVVNIWPVGHDRARLDSYAIIPEPATTEKARTYWDANMAILRGAVDEDLVMGESIQAGLASGANEDVVFGAFEHALRHFHAQIDEATAR